jgi:hypothetical protein
MTDEVIKDLQQKIEYLKDDNRRLSETLKMINEKLPRYNWKETVSLPDRLRAMAHMMNMGAAWGFCGESLFLEQAADLLEEKDV